MADNNKRKYGYEIMIKNEALYEKIVLCRDFFRNPKSCLEARKTIKNYSRELLKVLAEIDESFIEDIITLCLCVVTIDGKISLKERNYIKKLIKA